MRIAILFININIIAPGFFSSAKACFQREGDGLFVKTGVIYFYQIYPAAFENLAGRDLKRLTQTHSLTIRVNAQRFYLTNISSLPTNTKAYWNIFTIFHNQVELRTIGGVSQYSRAPVRSHFF